MIKFIVYGTAKSKGSYKGFTRDGKMIPDNPKSKDWQHLVAVSAQQYRPKSGPFDEAVQIIATFYFARPKSVSEAKRPYMTVKPDIDKILRAILDGMSGIIYTDDARIIRVVVEKHYCTIPRVEIEVIPA